MSGELKTDLRKQVSVPTALLLTALWLVPAFSGSGQLRGPKVTQETQLPQKLQRPASGRNLETNIRKTAKLIAYQIAKKAGV
jgi:hypothetical protein